MIKRCIRCRGKEYASLPDSKAFHSLTELHRQAQKIKNMSVICDDLVLSLRCSLFLGHEVVDGNGRN